jgi:hypothetical protein
MSAAYTPRQIAQLTARIADHFTLPQLERAALIGLRTPVNHITLASNLPGVIFALCQEANRSSRMTDFLRGLKDTEGDADTERSKRLNAALDTFTVTGSLEGADPFATLLITELPPVPVVNRLSLREYLRSLTNRDAAYGAISINGPSPCGKTYSKNLIRHIATWKGATPLVIEVVNESRALTLIDTMKKIAKLLGQPLKDLAELLIDNPTDARAAELFVDSMAEPLRAAAEEGKQYWIVFDGLDRSAAGPVRDNLVPYLLKSIADGNVMALKVFLLGDDGTRIVDARHIVLHESAQTITQTEIGDFLTACAAQKGWDLKAQQQTQLLSYVIGGASPPFDHKALHGIRERLEQILLRLCDPNKSVAELLEAVL